MQYTLSEAAKAVGKNRTTLFRYIKSGKLSAKFIDKQYIIDPAELHRVFEPLQSISHETLQNNDQQYHETEVAMAKFEAENRLLREMVENLKGSIDDIRADRDQWRQHATALLTHQPTQTEEKPVSLLYQRLFCRRK